MTQQLVVIAIVAAAAVYVGRKAWRVVRRPAKPSGPGCGGDCCGH